MIVLIQVELVTWHCVSNYQSCVSYSENVLLLLANSSFPTLHCSQVFMAEPQRKTKNEDIKVSVLYNTIIKSKASAAYSLVSCNIAVLNKYVFFFFNRKGYSCY